MSYSVSNATGSSGVKVATVPSSFHSNPPGIAAPPTARSVTPASADARSIGWLNAITIGSSGSTNFAPSCGVTLVTAGWIVEKLHV